MLSLIFLLMEIPTRLENKEYSDTIYGKHSCCQLTHNTTQLSASQLL